MKCWKLVAIAAVLVGCASATAGYRGPDTSARPNYAKEVSRSRDLVWNDAVAALGQRFFIINNIDKASGLMNISYSGDPTRFVDCGRLTVTVSGVNAKTQTLDMAAADALYESVAPLPPYGLPGRVQVRRQMALEGRVNIIFEAVGADLTRITTATRYVLTRKLAATATLPYSDTVGFNGNEKGVFPPLGANPPLECVSTGELEKSILSTIK